jgi:hypothetical protein
MGWDELRKWSVISTRVLHRCVEDEGCKDLRGRERR